MELASFHHLGAYNFEVAVKCSDNCCIPRLDGNIKRIFSRRTDDFRKKDHEENIWSY